MGRVTVVQDGVCLKTDEEIIRQALMAKTGTIERVLGKTNLSPNERLMLQDEYERTFALSEKYGRK